MNCKLSFLENYFEILGNKPILPIKYEFSKTYVLRGNKRIRYYDFYFYENYLTICFGFWKIKITWWINCIPLILEEIRRDIKEIRRRLWITRIFLVFYLPVRFHYYVGRRIFKTFKDEYYYFAYDKGFNRLVKIILTDLQIVCWRLKNLLKL